MAEESSTSLTSTIADAAAGPKSVKGDEAEVEAQPLPDLIAADKHLASKAAGRSRHMGIRRGTFVPPGAV